MTNNVYEDLFKHYTKVSMSHEDRTNMYDGLAEVSALFETDTLALIIRDFKKQFPDQAHDFEYEAIIVVGLDNIEDIQANIVWRIVTMAVGQLTVNK